jgi:UDP-N-acetylmuramoyl-tripeptide--D-alanyl-D-alanine ligase
MKLLASEVLQDLLGEETLTRRWQDALCFEGVATDTRQNVQGRLFVALRGERFDAHDFVDAALQCGARGVLVRRDTWNRWHDLPVACLGVEEPLRALQSLARASLRRHPAQVVAITGSNGKTTTKDLVAAALGSIGSVHATRGNLNNHIGTPLTVLARDGTERFLVSEIGANDFGEIEMLSRLLTPQVAVITNIGRAHLERFGSLQGVLQAKTEVFRGLGPDGLALLNADDAFLKDMRRAAAPRRTITFGFAADADYRIEESHDDVSERQLLRVHGTAIRLARAGRGNARNAAAAFAVACELGGVPSRVAQALEACVPTPQRSCWLRLGEVAVLDDSYNANPDSMTQALEMLVAHPGRHVAVLGDMGELGTQTESLHAEIGRSVASLKVDLFLAMGTAMRHAVAAAVRAGLEGRARHFETHDALYEELLQQLRPGDAVLVKGSRFVRMERIVEALRQEVR